MKRQYDRFIGLPERPADSLSNKSLIKQDVAAKGMDGVALDVSTPLVSEGNKNQDWSQVLSPFSADSTVSSRSSSSSVREEAPAATPLRIFGGGGGGGLLSSRSIGNSGNGKQDLRARATEAAAVPKKQSSLFAGLSSKSTSVANDNNSIELVMTSSRNIQTTSSVIGKSERDKGAADAQDKKEDVKYSTVQTPIQDVKKNQFDSLFTPFPSLQHRFRFQDTPGCADATPSINVGKAGSVSTNQSMNCRFNQLSAANNLTFISVNNGDNHVSSFLATEFGGYDASDKSARMHQFIALPQDDGSDGEGAAGDGLFSSLAACSEPMSVLQRVNDLAVYGQREFHPTEPHLLLADRKSLRGQANVFEIAIIDVNTMGTVFSRVVGEKGCRHIAWSGQEDCSIIHFAAHHNYIALDTTANTEVCVQRRDSAQQSIDVHPDLPHLVQIVMETEMVVFDSRMQRNIAQLDVSRGIGCAYFHPQLPSHVVYASNNSLRMWSYNTGERVTNHVPLLYNARSITFIPNSSQLLVTHQRSNIVTLCDPTQPSLNLKQLSVPNSVTGIVRGDSECSLIYSQSKGVAGDVVSRHYVHDFTNIAPSEQSVVIDITQDHLLTTGNRLHRSVQLGVDHTPVDVRPAFGISETRHKGALFTTNQNACTVSSSQETVLSMISAAQDGHSGGSSDLQLFPCTANGLYYIDRHEGVDFTQPLPGYMVTSRQQSSNSISRAVFDSTLFVRKPKRHPTVRLVKLGLYQTHAHPWRYLSTSTQPCSLLSSIICPISPTGLLSPTDTMASYAKKQRLDVFTVPSSVNFQQSLPSHLSDRVDVCLLLGMPPPLALLSSLETQTDKKIPLSQFLFLSPLIRRIYAFLHTCLYNKRVCESFACPRIRRVSLLWLTLAIAIVHHLDNITQNVVISTLQAQEKCSCSVQHSTTNVQTLKGLYGADVATIQAPGKCILCSLEPNLDSATSLLQLLSSELVHTLKSNTESTNMQNAVLFELLERYKNCPSNENSNNNNNVDKNIISVKNNISRLLVSSVMHQCISSSDVISLSAMTCCISTSFSKASYMATTQPSSLTCAFGVDPPPQLLPPLSQYGTARSLYARLRKYYKLLSNVPVDPVRSKQSFPTCTPAYARCVAAAEYMQTYISHHKHISFDMLPLLQNALHPLDVGDDVFIRKEASPVLLQLIHVQPERTRLEAVTAALHTLKRIGEYTTATAMLKHCGVPFLFEANKRGVGHAVSCGMEHSNPLGLTASDGHTTPYQLLTFSLLDAPFLHNTTSQKAVIEDNSDQTARPAAEAVLSDIPGISEMVLVDEVVCCICNCTTNEHIVACSSCNHASCLSHANEWFAQYQVCPAGCGCTCRGTKV